jgi:hypothetical protein
MDGAGRLRQQIQATAEDMMNKAALGFGVGAALLLSAGTAGAADCLTEVQSLQKEIAAAHKVSRPAMGSEQTASVSGTTSATSEATNPAPAATAPAATAPDATAPDATTGTITPGDDPDTSGALAALTRAKEYASAGNEGACVEQLKAAKQALGTAEQ